LYKQFYTVLYVTCIVPCKMTASEAECQ